MRWSARQRGMLEAMGIRLWDRANADAGGPPDVGPVDVAAAEAAAGALASAKADAGARAPMPSTTLPDRQAARPAPAGTADAARPTPGGAPAASRVQPPSPIAAPRTVADDARSRAIAAMDWTALQAAVAGCTACGLCESRRHTVFGVGHAQADWMLVGEAPGEQEDLQGEPFVGAAGQLLDEMLAAVGLTRQPAEPTRQVYIANTLKCRPPRNRNPSDEELAACAPHLHRQIELVQPRLLLATGRYAVRQLLGSEEAIGRLRGRLHDYRGIPVVVTYHPSYLLRQPTEKGKAWRDLLLAASVLGA